MRRAQPSNFWEEQHDALAAALDHLCTDSDLRRQLGAANRAVATEHYGAEECLERFCRVYRDACR